MEGIDFNKVLYFEILDWSWWICFLYNFIFIFCSWSFFCNFISCGFSCSLLNCCFIEFIFFLRVGRLFILICGKLEFLFIRCLVKVISCWIVVFVWVVFLRSVLLLFDILEVMVDRFWYSFCIGFIFLVMKFFKVLFFIMLFVVVLFFKLWVRWRVFCMIFVSYRVNIGK